MPTSGALTRDQIEEHLIKTREDLKQWNNLANMSREYLDQMDPVYHSEEHLIKAREDLKYWVYRAKMAREYLEYWIDQMEKAGGERNGSPHPDPEM